MLLVERTVATPPAEGVGLGVPLTVRKSGCEFSQVYVNYDVPKRGGTYTASEFRIH